MFLAQIPSDVIRSILLHCSLRDIYMTSQILRINLSDSWWVQYFYHCIPTQYHPLFLEVTKEYIKTEGHLIIRKVQTDDQRSLHFLQELRQPNIIRLFTEPTRFWSNRIFFEIPQPDAFESLGVVETETDGRLYSFRKFVYMRDGKRNLRTKNITSAVQSKTEYNRIIFNLLFNSRRRENVTKVGVFTGYVCVKIIYDPCEYE